ncbi:MAG: PIG-L family deacetylase [Gemmatimonadota bacterium]|nr:PIG-L family deacetylase [Gemmatimonadota bacterium]
MKAFQDKIFRAAETGGEVLFMGAGAESDRWIAPPGSGKIMVLAPHPDDAEAVAVTLRLFAEAGCEVQYKICCLSPSGVTDEFAERKAEAEGVPIIGADELSAYKKIIRRAEQLESTRLAGFPGQEGGDCVKFLDLEENSRGSLLDTEKNAEAIAGVLSGSAPDIVLMPWEEDTNSDHVLVCRYFRRAAEMLAASTGRPMLGLYIRDPKTLVMTEHLAVPFGEKAARWKAGLLKAHRSQHERNLSLRGHGMDERILQVNRDSWQRISKIFPSETAAKYFYAEIFQVELFH